MKNWVQFFIDRPENVQSNDKGMTIYGLKVLGNKVVKDQIKAIEKYDLCRIA